MRSKAFDRLESSQYISVRLYICVDVTAVFSGCIERANSLLTDHLVYK